MITKRERQILAPLLEEGGLVGNEWAMHCPYHGDSRRSASLNVEDAVWYCQGCNETGPLGKLIHDVDNWNLTEIDNSNGKSSRKPKEDITETKVEGWHSGLLGRREILKELMGRKGLTLKTIKSYEIGWDQTRKAYTIPIRDLHGDLVNVRRYQLDAPDDRRKIWSVDGMGTPTLFPVDQIESPSILICEGEWDALLSIQNGIPAITRTGAADVWKSEWSYLFHGKKVFICHDADTKGQKANAKIAASVRRHAREVRIVELPYEITTKNGKDLGDFWVEGNTRNDFTKMALAGQKLTSLHEQLNPENPEEEIVVSVRDSFDSHLVEKSLRLEVTVTGKRTPSYLIPQEIMMVCDMSAGKRCDSCSLATMAGQMPVEISEDSPMILSLVESSEAQVMEIVRRGSGVAKCDRPEMNVTKHRTVEEIFVRPSIESGPCTIEDQDFTHRRVLSTVSHDLTANMTLDLVGTIRPNPRTSTNEFQAWKVEKPENTLDSFQVTDPIRQQLEVFKAEPDDPRGALEAIAEDLSVVKTHIYGRPLAHIFMDLVFHSALMIPFGDTLDSVPVRGWLDALVMGDTRTGKSEIAQRLIELYGMGEMVSCESATYAGVVGGLDRQGDNRWIVKWGSIPINDRRIVVLDEVSGLLPEQIAQMSAIRSSGVAEMTKIQNERAMARTRLLWLANPRDARMGDYTYGVQAIKPLVGNPEDIARFDMAMGVYSADVDASLINRQRRRPEESAYGQENYRALLKWAWTRKPEDIFWRGQTKKELYAAATRMGNRYIEQPPLIQGANVRIKLARIATAIAIRTYSTGPKGTEVYVTPHHVQAAEQFLNDIYGHQMFGYDAISNQRHIDTERTDENINRIMSYLVEEQGLTRYLKSSPVVDRMAMEAVLNMSRERSGAVINELWKLRAVRIDGEVLRLEEEVLKLIREITND